MKQMLGLMLIVALLLMLTATVQTACAGDDGGTEITAEFMPQIPASSLTDGPSDGTDDPGPEMNE